MNPDSIKAHFDGQYIVLDEPYPLKADTKLLVTVLTDDGEKEQWMRLSARRLEDAFEESEPEYSLTAVREKNPDYGRR